MIRKHLGFGLNIIALGLFFPGILLTMFSFDMEMKAILSGSSLTSALIDKELSIMATVQELWDDQRLLVAGLIFVFSVCIPLLKTLLITCAYFMKQQLFTKKLVDFVNLIGKWSMADVFVVAIFLAILSTNHAETATAQNISVFGFNIALEISTQTLSSAGEGFYYFVGYCVLAMIGSQLSSSAIKSQLNNTKSQIE
ncbi:paraquat-inducible protein A [Paraglaciecola sp.]|uniref:paraquat-inducible protein A n=1 Tax=Paraglaciecola sp. TaxID=1920173 RepID=UPI003EF3FDCB